MDITIYLPDELGQWAKDGKYNLSRLLRDMLERFQAQQKAATGTLKGAAEFKLPMEDSDGRGYVLRFRGTRIAEQRDTEVFLTEGERVLVYDGNKLRHWITEDTAEELRELLDDEAYLDAMHAIGIEPVIDLAEVTS